MTLTEFLLARIAEDEAHLPEGFDCWYAPERYAAECDAKRRIVEAYPVKSVLIGTPEKPLPQVTFAGDRKYWGSSYAPGMKPISDDEWAEFVARNAVEEVPEVLRLLALPYADHPDYDPAWATDALA